MTKKILRKTIIKRRGSQSSAQIAAKSARICQQLIDWPIFRAAQSLMLYIDYKSEVQTAAIIDYCLKRGKAVIVPVVAAEPGQLALVEITAQTEFNKSPLGILEPAITAPALRQLADIDLILAPGVAFDLAGNRLGYGGGYYDRLLAKAPAERRRIAVYGLAFECQIVASIPTEPTDCKIDGLITERQIYQF